MMINSMYNLSYNPFSKANSQLSFFESNDYKGSLDRLNYLTRLNGFGLFTGNPGLGKTYTLNKFVSSLNPALFKVVYIQTSTITVNEFYKALCYGLGVLPSHKKIDMFRDIQDTITNFVIKKNRKVIIIIDEAQYLKSSILHDLKLIFNFDMDQKDYAAIVLLGLPVLSSLLSRNIYEPLRQRIIVNYFFEGLSRDELNTYVSRSITNAGNPNPIFSDDALTAVFSHAGGSIRKVNLLLEKALAIGAAKKISLIDSETIRIAQVDVDIT